MNQFPDKLTVKDTLKILGISTLAVSSLAVPGIGIAYKQLSKEWRRYKKGDIGRIVKRLHRQDLVRISDNEGKTTIELSDKGKNKLLQYNFEELSLKRKRDGKLRVVIFDIPNTKKLSRDVLRRKLKELGFIKIQESVFLTPYICQDELEFIINYLNLTDHVMLFQR